MNLNNFISELKKINIEITDIQLEQLNKYYELLVEYNKVMNLTGITEKEQVYLKHFYDSLTLIKVIDPTKEETLCDVGTGAGFPGLVIKILFPNLKVTLVDSLNKRIEFLKKVIQELNLKDIEAIHARAEEFSKLNREKFDIVTSRAVAPLNILLEYNIPLLKTNKYKKSFIFSNYNNNFSSIRNTLTKISPFRTFDLDNINTKQKLVFFKHKPQKNFLRGSSFTQMQTYFQKKI